MFQTLFHTKNKKTLNSSPYFFTLDQATSPAGRKLRISPQQPNEEQHLPAHDSHTWPTCRRYAYSFFFFCFPSEKQTNALFFLSLHETVFCISLSFISLFWMCLDFLREFHTFMVWFTYSHQDFQFRKCVHYSRTKTGHLVSA